MDYSCSLPLRIYFVRQLYVIHLDVAKDQSFSNATSRCIYDRLRTTPRVLPLGGGVDPEGLLLRTLSLSKALVIKKKEEEERHTY